MDSGRCCDGAAGKCIGVFVVGVGGLGLPRGRCVLIRVSLVDRLRGAWRGPEAREADQL